MKYIGARQRRGAKESDCFQTPRKKENASAFTEDQKELSQKQRSPTHPAKEPKKALRAKPGPTGKWTIRCQQDRAGAGYPTNALQSSVTDAIN